jgi:glycosyltransferase involved in cell wall biosynthesis
MVIPMFNEEENIEHAIDCAIEALEAHARDYEIIIVDDASTDQSPHLVERAVEKNEKVFLIRHAFNQKLGASLRSGFARARYEIVLYMDADLPFDPDTLGRALRAINVSRADLIAGYRFDRTTEGFKRTVYSIAYNALIRVLFGHSIRDINFSFKLMRREVLDAIELRSEGSLIDAELILKARNLGFAVQQIGMDYFPRSRGESTLSSPKVIVKIFGEIVRLFGDIRRPQRRSIPAGPDEGGGPVGEPATDRHRG